jgi:hypothetical protein
LILGLTLLGHLLSHAFVSGLAGESTNPGGTPSAQRSDVSHVGESLRDSACGRTAEFWWAIRSLPDYLQCRDRANETSAIYQGGMWSAGGAGLLGGAGLSELSRFPAQSLGPIQQSTLVPRAYLPLVMRKFRAIDYFVDSVNGSDSNPGTSEDRPWQTLAPVHARHFLPGEVVGLRRGSSWSGGLVVDDSGVEGSPIIFTTYGAGEKPIIRNSGEWSSCVRIEADWVIVEGLFLEGAHEAGVFIASDSDNDLVQDCEVTDVGIGVAIRGEHNLVMDNYVHDLHMVRNTPGGDDDHGAVGIWFFGSNNEASYNVMVRCKAPSYDYGFDGGVFEFYGVADNNYFHHNWGTESNCGFEVSGGSANDNVVAYNVLLNNSGCVAVFHIHEGGYGSDVRNFRFENNVVVETQNSAYSVFWFSDTPTADMLTMRNNIFRIDRTQYVFNRSSFTHDHNLYHVLSEGTRMSHRDSFVAGEGELLADPLFVDAAGEDFHLQVGSPAIDAGAELGYSVDFEGRPVPLGAAPDMGAFEFGD